jgi:hypothetical protein
VARSGGAPQSGGNPTNLIVEVDVDRGGHFEPPGREYMDLGTKSTTKRSSITKLP